MCGVFESNRKKLHLLSGVAILAVALVRDKSIDGRESVKFIITRIILSVLYCFPHPKLQSQMFFSLKNTLKRYLLKILEHQNALPGAQWPLHWLSHLSQVRAPRHCIRLRDLFLSFPALSPVLFLQKPSLPFEYHADFLVNSLFRRHRGKSKKNN